MNEYGHFCRPNLVRFLEAIRLDAQYERAEGDFLWQRRGEHLTRVLDFVGGYGATLFGHNHPELVAEMRRVLDDQAPILAQGSCRMSAGKLASALSQRLGDFMVVFTNSGAETVEAALKHAFLENHRSTFWAVKGAFHGKTLGAIQLTWSYAPPFSSLGPRVRFLDPEDPNTWREAERSAEDVAGAFVEPILGEGGIKPLPHDFASWLGEVCHKAKIPLIADEIQSGIGRTGHFLASQSLGLEPDYICLSKALGGGIVKIGALLIKRERFQEEFSLIHTSTFAEDELSCRVALMALEILDRDALPQKCAAAGEYLLAKLKHIQDRFPEQVKDVRGIGLMAGIELREQPDSPSNSLLLVSKQKLLGYVSAAYLLTVHNVRLAPTLSEPFTLRLEPSAYISNEAIDQCVHGLWKLCELLEAQNVAPLVRQQLGKAQTSLKDCRGKHRSYREEPRTAARVAFIGNLILPEHAVLFDASLEEFSAEELETHQSQISQVTAPCIYDQINIRSGTDEKVHFSFIGLGVTARQIMESIQQCTSKWVLEKIREAVELARLEGCTVVGLGGHTSIVSANGLFLRGCETALTTGNALTIGMGVRAMRRACEKRAITLSHASLAVVGATGNIASTYAMVMAPEFASIYLVGRSANSPRLVAIAEEIRKVAPGNEIHLTDSLDVLTSCSVVVSASNSPNALIFPKHIAAGPVVICDIAVPGDLDDSVQEQRPDVEIVKGALVRLPHNEDFRIAGMPLSDGHAFPCMVETMLMGLENIRKNGSYGAVTADQVHQMCALANKHGFSLAE